MVRQKDYILVCGIILAFLFVPLVAGGMEAAGAGERRQRLGEKITYGVILGKMRLGEAKFEDMGPTELNGRKVNLIIFKTNVVNFSDTENIYSDPDSYLPVRIERDISNFFGHEKITEDYDQKNHRVTITKNKGKNQEQVVIAGTGPLHNAILFPDYVREIPDLKIGMVFSVNLPGKAPLKVKIVSIDKLRTPVGRFEAFHFESAPKQISVWISTDSRRIPIKIEGVGVFGYTLLLKNYNP